jgi:hypothetical protein
LPPAATRCRVGRRRPSILRRPFAETKEMLAGSYLIDVPDLNAALA